MSALDHLKDFRIVLISLPLKDEQPITLECVARRRSVDTVEVAFLAGQLPVDSLDLKGPCRLFFEEQGRPFRLKSLIEEIVDGEKLRLKAVEAATHFGSREFFRVDANLTVKCRRLSEGEDAHTHQFAARVNISGCGIRLPLPEPVRLNEKLALTFILSQEPLKVAHCVAEVIRLCPFAGGEKGAALHFVEIESSDRDAIVAFCMAAQREELRNKIQTRDMG